MNKYGLTSWAKIFKTASCNDFLSLGYDESKNSCEIDEFWSKAEWKLLRTVWIQWQSKNSQTSHNWWKMDEHICETNYKQFHWNVPENTKLNCSFSNVSSSFWNGYCTINSWKDILWIIWNFLIFWMKEA